MTQEPNTKPEAPTYFIVQANAPFSRPYWVNRIGDDLSLLLGTHDPHLLAAKFDTHAQAVEAIEKLRGEAHTPEAMIYVIWGIFGCDDPAPKFSWFTLVSIHAQQPDAKWLHIHKNLQGVQRWFMRWAVLQDEKEVECFRSFDCPSQAHALRKSLIKGGGVLWVSGVYAYAKDARGSHSDD